MGGDLAPKAASEGAVLAARDRKIEMVLVGEREIIVKELADYDTSGLTINIEHAAQVVAMDDAPLESLLGKPDSSMHVGLDLVKSGGADGFVSAGNSGAIMAAPDGSFGHLSGCDPAPLASLVPNT